MTLRMSSTNAFGIPGNSFNMFFLSLALHAIVLAAVLISVPGTTRTLTFGATYSVALVGADMLQSHHSANGIERMLPSSAQAERAVVLKRDASGQDVQPSVKKDDTLKTDIEKAINAIRQKSLSDNGEVDRDAPRAGAPPGASAASPEHPSRISDYSRFIWPEIRKNWALPASLMPKENVMAVIEVRIAKNGQLEYINFEKRSGNRYFDESALRAVKKSAPFPPLDGWVTDTSIEIGIRFHSAELR